MAKTQNSQAVERFGWRIREWAEAVGICRSSVSALVLDGKIETVPFGKRQIIVTHPRDWLASLKKAGDVAQGKEAA